MTAATGLQTDSTTQLKITRRYCIVVTSNYYAISSESTDTFLLDLNRPMDMNYGHDLTLKRHYDVITYGV